MMTIELDGKKVSPSFNRDKCWWRLHYKGATIIVYVTDDLHGSDREQEHLQDAFADEWAYLNSPEFVPGLKVSTPSWAGQF